MSILYDKIQAYIDDIQATQIENIQDRAARVEMFRVKYLGKKGVINELFEQFKAVPNDEKKELGKAPAEFYTPPSRPRWLPPRSARATSCSTSARSPRMRPSARPAVACSATCA